MENLLFLGVPILKHIRYLAGGVMVLDKLPMPGRPTNLDHSRAKAYCPCSGCGWGLFGRFFLSPIISLFLSPSLWETARYRLKYCLKGLLSPKQPTIDYLIMLYKLAWLYIAQIGNREPLFIQDTSFIKIFVLNMQTYLCSNILTLNFGVHCIWCFTNI